MAKIIDKRRRSQRFALHLYAGFHWQTEDGSQREGYGFTREMSEHGVFVITKTCPHRDAVIDLQFHLPRIDNLERLMTMHGRVVRTEIQGQEYGFAVCCKKRLRVRSLNLSQAAR